MIFPGDLPFGADGCKGTQGIIHEQIQPHFLKKNIQIFNLQNSQTFENEQAQIF